MNKLKSSVDEAAYKSMLKVNPGVIDLLKQALKSGQTAKQIEKVFRKKYGTGNLTAMSAVCAAYYVEAHPELLQPEACPACGTLLTEPAHDPTCPLVTQE